MKRNAFLCLCLCLCLLFSACGTPSDGSSAPAEEGSEVPPVPEDPNVKAVRAYLEELLAAEWKWGTVSDAVEWVPSDRLESIRNCVKKVKAPILTEGDVLHIAERAAAFYNAALEEERAFFLPAYGPVGAIRKAPTKSFSYSEHAMAYNALLAYTFYLFTPPDYLFRETDLNEAGLPTLAQSSLSSADVALCLPLAGEYTTRREALAAVREKGGCVLLYPPEIGEGEYLLDFTYCYYAADYLESAGCTKLDLLTWAGDSFLRYLNAPNYVRALMERCRSAAYVPWEPLYDGAGALVGASMPFSPEIARELREMTDLLSEPLFEAFQIEDLAPLFQKDAIGTYDPTLPILLPDADGTGDVTLNPETISLDERLRRAFAYTMDLFTPRAYRFTDLTDRAGTYFATGNWIRNALMPGPNRPPDTPETMLAYFYAGEQQFVLVTEDYELYLIDGEGNTEPLLVRKGGEGAMT